MLIFKSKKSHVFRDCAVPQICQEKFYYLMHISHEKKSKENVIMIDVTWVVY